MKKLVLLLVIGGFILSGCKQTPNDEPEFERDVAIQFTVNSLSSSSLKSTGSTEERLVNEVILYGANTSGSILKIFSGLTGSELISGVTLRMSSTITTLYAIANPTGAMKTASPSTVASLTATTNDYSTAAPGSPFVMSGNKTVAPTMTIDLERSIAKITVSGTGGFVFQTFTVKNASTEGYVFRQPAFALPSNGKRDYPASNLSTAYVAENSTVTPTTLTVTGAFAGETYTVNVPFLLGGIPVNIERNKCYNVTVAPAAGQEPVITINVVEWDDVNIDTQEFDF